MFLSKELGQGSSHDCQYLLLLAAVGQSGVDQSLLMLLLLHQRRLVLIHGRHYLLSMMTESRHEANLLWLLYLLLRYYGLEEG